MFSKIKNVKNRLNYKMCYTVPNEIIPNLAWETFRTLPFKRRLNIYLKSAKQIEDIKYFIPKKHLQQKKHTVPENLYLVDSRIAKDIVKHISPALKNDQIVCETNAGLGFITSELFDGGLQTIRLYETCPDFRLTLKGFSDAYPGRVELFGKDLFQIWRMSYIDKIDKGNRVAQYLKEIPKRKWSDSPVMTIIGTMSKLDFMFYMFKMISFQSEIATYGRPELFVIMRPGDYIKLTAGPHRDLHTYQVISVFANIFCELKLIEKYPRIAFVPWESFAPPTRYTRSFKRHDMDKLYLVHIKFRKELPMKNEHLLPFYFFLKQVFGRGTIPLIQKLEKWISGIGQQIILPKESYYLGRDMDVFVKSGQLTSLELLEIFKILYDHQDYQNSSFTAMVDAELLKFETVETDIAEMHKVAVQSV